MVNILQKSADAHLLYALRHVLIPPIQNRSCMWEQGFLHQCNIFPKAVNLFGCIDHKQY